KINVPAMNQRGGDFRNVPFDLPKNAFLGGRIRLCEINRDHTMLLRLQKLARSSHRCFPLIGIDFFILVPIEKPESHPEWYISAKRRINSRTDRDWQIIWQFARAEFPVLIGVILF